MTTTTNATGATRRNDDFDIEVTDAAPSPTPPQRMGGRLWAPMLGLGLLGFVVGLILAFFRSSAISDADPADVDRIASLGHLVPAFVFLGLFGVFSGISLAIARILGIFREGGGIVQQKLGVPVQTLRMPLTGKAFMMLMMLGAMVSMFAIAAHIVVALTVPSLDPDDLTRAAQWGTALGGVRRIAAASYLAGISMGLATIIYVIRFQTVRVRELAAPSSSTTSTTTNTNQ